MKKKQRLSHLARMSGNIASGILMQAVGQDLYDKDSYQDKVADESVAIAEKILIRLEAIEDDMDDDEDEDDE